MLTPSPNTSTDLSDALGTLPNALESAQNALFNLSVILGRAGYQEHSQQAAGACLLIRDDWMPAFLRAQATA